MNTPISHRGSTRDRAGSYSPGRRTALVLCGSGAHGAYHAGVLRALQEAGVKIDLVAGHGVGAGAAALAAIDGAARLWDPDGVWRSPAVQTFYSWKPLLRVAGWVSVLLALVLAVPLLVLAAAAVVYGIGFLLTLVSLRSLATAVLGAGATLLQGAFAADELPLVVPRLAMVIVAALVLLGVVGTSVSRWRARVKRRSEGGWWWDLAGSPVDASGARAAFIDAIWQLIRGAGPVKAPAVSAVGRRYAEVLAENVGQPGFRELLVVATDLDTRRDIVVSMLREPFRGDFMTSAPGRDRRVEVLDLAAAGRDNGLDVVAAALTPPIVCEPALVAFSVDSVWRGETHRVCDRPSSCSRLLEEVAAAGVSQVVVVSAVSPHAQPHRLTAPRLDPRHRLGDFIVAEECAALRDALESSRRQFESVYLVCPYHTAIGPFDFAGVYDEASDRRERLEELMDRGYDDVYKQFIEPIVGGSGEQIAQAAESNELRLGF